MRKLTTLAIGIVALMLFSGWSYGQEAEIGMVGDWNYRIVFNPFGSTPSVDVSTKAINTEARLSITCTYMSIASLGEPEITRKNGTYDYTNVYWRIDTEDKIKEVEMIATHTELGVGISLVYEEQDGTPYFSPSRKPLLDSLRTGNKLYLATSNVSKYSTFSLRGSSSALDIANRECQW